MEILHILRSEPDEMVQMFVEELCRGEKKWIIRLDQGKVDYDDLVKDIFSAERIITWW